MRVHVDAEKPGGQAAQVVIICFSVTKLFIFLPTCSNFSLGILEIETPFT